MFFVAALVQRYQTFSSFAITLSSNLFPTSHASAPAIAAGTAITTVTSATSTNKDVQPKSPGVNDEDDDEGLR